MKPAIKHFFPLICTTICVIFGISILFHQSYGTIFSDIPQNDHSSIASLLLNAQNEASLPSLVYIGNSLTIETAYSLSDLFLSESEENISLRLVDVKSTHNNSVLTCLSNIELSNLIDITAPVTYDTDNQLLYFHQSGVYTICFRLYHNHRPGVLFECQIPVETR